MTSPLVHGIGPPPAERGDPLARALARTRSRRPLPVPGEIEDVRPGRSLRPPRSELGLPAGDVPGFLVQEWLARSATAWPAPPPEPGPSVIAAYQAHLALRTSYSGPVRPVDLRV